jgi:hypothetical protein
MFKRGLDCRDRIFFEIGVDPQSAFGIGSTTQPAQFSDPLFDALKDWRNHGRVQFPAPQFQVVEDFLPTSEPCLRALHDSRIHRERIPGQ